MITAVVLQGGHVVKASTPTAEMASLPLRAMFRAGDFVITRILVDADDFRQANERERPTEARFHPVLRRR